ncbi:MAG: hypothetical protein JRG73_16410 [Deltaproteobacteria bacterium]|nr:hypothetical protein [Deltaproteobacteria bacterium]
MADKSRLRIMVGGNKPRLSVRVEGDQVVIDCAKCFADFLRTCKWAIDRQSSLPSYESADCVGYHGRATFPREAYDLLVRLANRERIRDVDVPLSLQTGAMTDQVPTPTSLSDIEAAARKAASDAVARMVRVTPNDAEIQPSDHKDSILVDQDSVYHEPSLDEILNAEPEPVSPLASKAAIALAETHRIDLASIKKASKHNKIDVRDVRAAIRERNNG